MDEKRLDDIEDYLFGDGYVPEDWIGIGTDDAADMLAEIRRLRDALAPIASIDPWECDDYGTGESYCFFCGANKYDGHKDNCSWSAARKALGLEEG